MYNRYAVKIQWGTHNFYKTISPTANGKMIRSKIGVSAVKS